MLPSPASMHRRVRVHPARPEMNCSPPKVLLAELRNSLFSPLLSFSSVCQRLRKTAAAAPIHSPPRRRREHDNDSAIANVSKRAERGEVAADGGCFACHPITIDDDYDGDELGNRERRREAHRHRDERAER